MSNDDDAPASPAADSYYCIAITALDPVEAIRKRPGMYIGDIHDGSGLHNMVHELVREAVRHHGEGRCHRVSVTVRRSGAITVEDDGPGFSVEPLRPPYDPVSLLEVRFMVRCFARCQDALSSVNALSEEMFVEAHRDGHAYGQHHRRGCPVTPVVSLGTAEDTGSRVTFRPDPLIFPSPTFDARRLDTMLQPIAFLHPHLRVELIDERPGGARKTFHGAGIADWVARLTEGRDGFPAKPTILRASTEDLVLHAALRWTRWPTTVVRCFANDRERDTEAFLGGLVMGLRVAARRAELALPSGEHVQRGLTAIVDLRSQDECRWSDHDDVRLLVEEAFSAELWRQRDTLRELCGPDRI
jgi:DNA gyrase subunit B